MMEMLPISTICPRCCRACPARMYSNADPLNTSLFVFNCSLAVTNRAPDIKITCISFMFFPFYCIC